MPRKSRNQRVADEALKWVGTKFHDQASLKGVGTDCKGLVWGVARELKFPEAESFYATFVQYDLQRRGGIPHGLIREGMAALFDRVEQWKPGDIFLLGMDGKPCHFAIVSKPDRAVHAQVVPNDRVKETRIAALLSKFELDSIWRWRG